MFEENERIHLQQCSGNTRISIITQLLGTGKTECFSPVGQLPYKPKFYVTFSTTSFSLFLSPFLIFIVTFCCLQRFAVLLRFLNNGQWLINIVVESFKFPDHPKHMLYNFNFQAQLFGYVTSDNKGRATEALPK